MPAWRERRAALSKKSNLEAELLSESEIVITGKSVGPIQPPSSPVSVASIFNATPEIKPITLPDAWTVVGKGGRPLKNEKMYDAPNLEPKKAKKKRKKRMSKRETDSVGEDNIEPVLATLDVELPSSSAQALGRQLRHRKLVAHGLEAKAWVKYRQAKELRALARDMLVAALAEDGTAECDAGETTIGSEASSQHKAIRKVAYNNKTKSRIDMARRKARHAAASARCYWPEADDEHFPEQAQPEVGQRVTKRSKRAKKRTAEVKDQLRSETEPYAAPSDEKMDVGPSDFREFTLVEEELSSPHKPALLGKVAGWLRRLLPAQGHP